MQLPSAILCPFVSLIEKLYRLNEKLVKILFPGVLRDFLVNPPQADFVELLDSQRQSLKRKCLPKASISKNLNNGQQLMAKS